MRTHRFTTISLTFAGALLIAAGCSDDDEKLDRCKSGDCGGDTATGGKSTGTGGLIGLGGATTTVSTSQPSGGTTQTFGGSVGVGGATTVAGATSVSTSTAKGGSSAFGGTSALGGGAGVAGSGLNLAGSGATPVDVPAGVAMLKYDFEDGTGTKATDTSGNGKDGVLSGATWTANTEGRNAGAVSFASADAAIALPAGLFNNAQGFAVSAWVMLTANEPGNRLFEFGTGLGNHIYFALNNQSGGMELGVQINDGTLSTMFTTAMLPLNVWKHITVMMGASGAHLYVDGWEVARSLGMTTAPSALGTTTNNWIGKSLGPDPAFAGRIDEFYVFDNPIPLAQVRQLAWPKMDYSIWHFDESEGTVAADSSDFKRDATMVRATFNEGVVGNGAQLYNPNDTNEVPVGADQYVQLPEGVVKDCTQGYTVATWINVIATRSHARVFEFSNDTTYWIFARTKGGSTEQFALGDYSDGAPNSDANYASIAYTWPVNTWHHVAAVRNEQVIHAYIDGVESPPKTPTTLASTVPPASSLGSTLYNYIGRTRDGAAVNERRRLHGRVDEFLLSCRAYTPEEIKLLATRLQ